MKLNYGRTVRIGFAFLAICAFWQMYNNVIPLILTNTFHMNESLSGAIMAADNVLALFLLPLFGSLSDKCKSPMGRRKPFILAGTVLSVLLMLLVPVLDNRYFSYPSKGLSMVFVCVLGLLLIAMGTYRSPAVALMPDLTPKPFRSRANAVINLMGALGGIIYLILASILYSEARTKGLAHVNYLPLFLIVVAIMVLSLLIVLFTINEPALRLQVENYEKDHPEQETAPVGDDGSRTLPPAVKRSLIFLLISVSLWFISYNAVETWFTTYAQRMWGMSLGSASLCLTIATGGAILSYIPIGQAAARFGRRRVIIAGVVLLASCFFVLFIYTLLSGSFHPVLYLLLLLIGLAWAAINVNSLPMVLEMCSGAEIGRFTGLYYTFSMAAQIVTPVAAGTLMNRIGYTSLFIYSTLFAGMAFLTMSQVKHGDTKVQARRGLEAYDIDD
jgi:MFS family permease